MVVIDLNRSRFESGYWAGLRQPAFVFDIRFMKDRIQRSTLEQYDQIVEALLPQRKPWDHPQTVARHPLLRRLADSSMSILSAAGMPIMSGVNALPIRRQDRMHWLLGLCAVSADVPAPQWAIRWSIRLMRSLLDGREVDIESLRQDLQTLIEACKRQAPAGVNTLRFLQAAHEEDIPWRHVANNVYQFGWGSRARLLDSSFTDETPCIGAGLARDKQACAKLLREAGLPVPRHRLVGSEAQALEAAQALGYPVVVKAADLDGGRGVFVGLRDVQAVQKAYAAVREQSKRILVEQYVQGQDYRLQVYRGEVFWTVLRRPAYVTGDAEATVEVLIRRTNLERKRPPADPFVEQGAKPIIVDDEVNYWLECQGMTLASVPAAGQSVRLRGAANVSAGGTREAMLHQVHPDNQALAARAARVLRLDLAGVDLLIPDIARSWRESGAVICEVNGQPQLSPHLHRSLLPRMVLQQGRIPVVVLLGRSADLASLRQRVVALTSARGLRMGWAGADAIALDDEAWPQAHGGVATASGADTVDHVAVAVRTLLVDPQVDALIWWMPAWPDAAQGLPFDKVDALIWLDDEAFATANAVPANFSARYWVVSADNRCNAPRLATADLPRHLVALMSGQENSKREEHHDRV